MIPRGCFRGRVWGIRWGEEGFLMREMSGAGT
jgi:hypothetical protein